MQQHDRESHFLTQRTWLVSLLSAIFVAYPNNAWLLCDLDYLIPEAQRVNYIEFFILRFGFFWMIIWSILRLNRKRLYSQSLFRIFATNLALTLTGAAIYEFVTRVLFVNFDHWISIVVFQFIFIWLTTSFISYINVLFEQKQTRELEIERLKVENLESRCTALTNQINPHFFFNSLNGISSLVRKQDNPRTLRYINELSDIFRYVLQSERKPLVTLGEELDFINAFSHVLEVRYAGGKLKVNVDVPADKLSCRMPVLSLLPLIENVTTHNMIDSDHIMTVDIRVTDQNELTFENPIYPKLAHDHTSGTGLRNLASRFSLLLDKEIKVDNDGKTFKVTLPLEDEEE